MNGSVETKSKRGNNSPRYNAAGWADGETGRLGFGGFLRLSPSPVKKRKRKRKMEETTEGNGMRDGPGRVTELGGRDANRRDSGWILSRRCGQESGGEDGGEAGELVRGGRPAGGGREAGEEGRSRERMRIPERMDGEYPLLLCCGDGLDPSWPTILKATDQVSIGLLQSFLRGDSDVGLSEEPEHTQRISLPFFFLEMLGIRKS